MKRDQPKGSSISAGWHGSPSLSKHSSLFKRCKGCLPLALICVLVYTDRDYILGILRIRRLLPAVGIILKYSKGSESVPDAKIKASGCPENSGVRRVQKNRGYLRYSRSQLNPPCRRWCAVRNGRVNIKVKSPLPPNLGNGLLSSISFEY